MSEDYRVEEPLTSALQRAFMARTTTWPEIYDLNLGSGLGSPCKRRVRQASFEASPKPPWSKSERNQTTSLGRAAQMFAY